jgi:MFS family permease
MLPPSSLDPNISNHRRRGIVAANFNAALWGVGSGLASTTLMLYLARALGASGLAISWILAAPPLVGLLRLATPALLDRIGSRRKFCVAAFLASSGALLVLPLASSSSVGLHRSSAVFVLGASWTGFQLLDSLGAVALWSWLGDLVPRRVRGRVLGRHEGWLNAGVVAGTLLAIGITMLWDLTAPIWGAGDIQRNAYVACSVIAVGMFAAAALALLAVPEAPRPPRVSDDDRFRLRDLTAPIVDRKFRRLMVFGLWFSFSNGIVQTAQSLFTIGPLGVTYAWKRTLDGGLRAAKVAVLPRVGAAIDRVGNVRVLAASQAIIAAAMLFFLIATPEQPWWILGAYVFWTAYAGHDIALPNMMLGLSPPAKSAAYAAAWFAWTQLAFSLSVLAGGAAFDLLRDYFTAQSMAGHTISHVTLVLGVGFLLKVAGIYLAARISEPSREH